MKTIKNNLSGILLWAGLATVVLLLGAVSAVFLVEPARLTTLSGFSAIDQFFGVTPAQPPVSEAKVSQPPLAPGERRYRVAEGENLFAIARTSGLVDSQWEWRTIVAQNQDKIEYAFIAEQTGQWQVIVEKGQELRVRKEPFVIAEGPVIKKLALQLGSLPGTRRADAIKIVNSLLQSGNFAYLYHAEVEGKAVYRIRAGFYETRELAQQAGQRIQQRFRPGTLLPEQFFVVVPSERELRGELFDFGIQRTHPWVVELPPRTTHREALALLKQLGNTHRFPYIAQGKEKKTGAFTYRVRVGYFETRERAASFLSGQNQRDLWGEARAVSLTGFSEALPGQAIKMTPPRS